jgi:alcohol dehydrogenase (cytochrome c)
MSTPPNKPVANWIERLFFASALAAGTLGMSPAFAQTPAIPTVSNKPQVTPPKNDGMLRALTPVPAKMLLNPPENDWLMWRRTYDAWGYSPLKQINTDNVKNLTVAWTWAMTPGATETTPLVHDGVLFLYNWLDKVQALDATNGELLWEYKRDIPIEIPRQNGNNAAKRNMAMVDDKLIVATSDAHIVALDMKTGKVIWDHETEDYKKGWRYTGGPLVAANVIVQGMSGCGNAMPGGCFITGHDINTGKELWRFHTIAQPGEPGGDSWNGLPLEKRFGASTWNSGSYDPDTDTLFLGVGQPYPHIAEIGGLLPKKEGANNDALYTDATLALDPHTGKLKWYYQHLKNDTWDLDYAYERVLVDLPVDGKVRKAMVTVGKLGIIEVLDRTNGQWLWSKQTVYQNVVSAIDPKTGAKTINQDAVPHIGKTTTNCPADPGSRGWPATAYSPRTHMLYIPLNEYCSDTTPVPIEEGKNYTGGSRAIFARGQVPNSDGKIGRVDGVDLFTQKAVWSDRTRAPQTGAAVATGGGLVFAGALDRYFRAYDDKTGKILWQTRASNIVNSFPITYSVKGRQYVAVAVGNGSSHARSLATLTPEIGIPDGGSALFVFALPENTK